MIASIELAFPVAFWVCLLAFFLAALLVVLFALHNKDQVRAEISHGSTTFKLEAKGNPTRKQLR